MCKNYVKKHLSGYCGYFAVFFEPLNYKKTSTRTANHCPQGGLQNAYPKLEVNDID
jgi:hypothetical protein